MGIHTKEGPSFLLIGVLVAVLARHAYVYFKGDKNSAKDAAAAGNASEDIALFTHANNELHCMDRELRHPCVRELRSYLDDKSNEDTRTTALTCVRDVLATSENYWELKNMTHLLLDLDTVEHAFDRTSRDNDFVMAGVDFAQKLMGHPECLGDFDAKSELECRCVPLYGKVSILKLKNAKKTAEAQALFERLTTLTWAGEKRTYGAGEAVAWDHFQHTPQIWVKGLRSQPVWPRETWKDLPICKNLEDHFETIREETQRALVQSEDSFEDAYRFLYEKGEWNHILLYKKKEFTPECESVFPKTCALLKQWLPSKPGLPWTSDQNEQVMVIKMKKGTDVELHSGPANNILNIHIGISGLEGAELKVANETYHWEEGKVIAWDGSYDHSVNCVNCVADERVIMMVRYMHPDMDKEMYRGVPRTHFEDVPVELQ
eukprot:TRINITY_DN62811_c0_g1_i1.p2 TRINITY_DN62811_c0_g1~~TRINITY_DN62811_c0_g1_i1.p2  ORF type:complete len:432 (-),score=117.50 TRINITY_DN62811_c0_g1_i1:364-1659(-)